MPWDLEKMWMGHAQKDLADQNAEQLREDVKCHNFRNQNSLQSLPGKQHEVVEFEGG